MTIYIIVGVYKGCIEGVKVAVSLDEAYEQRDEYDERLGIERTADGWFESANADVQMYEVTIDKAFVVSNSRQLGV